MAEAKNNFVFKQKAALKRKLGEWLLKFPHRRETLPKNKRKPLTFCKEPRKGHSKIQLKSALFREKFIRA